MARAQRRLGSVPFRALTACETTDPYLAATSAGPVAVEQQYPEIKLSPGDKLRVTVFGEDKLSGDFDLDLNGNASLPLAGTVQLAGLTKQQAEATIARKLRSEYLRNPKVTVDVTSFRPSTSSDRSSGPASFPTATA